MAGIVYRSNTTQAQRLRDRRSPRPWRLAVKHLEDESEVLAPLLGHPQEFVESLLPPLIFWWSSVLGSSDEDIGRPLGGTIILALAKVAAI